MIDRSASVPRSPLLLNVDDNNAAHYAKTRILRHAGYDVIEARTGTEALQLVEERRPTFLILDVKLPDITGIEVCRRIKVSRPQILVLQTSASFVEPFFTTKEVGKGTGLGLSMVYGFAKQSGGHVKLHSERGVGTTVKIYLPRKFGSVSEVTVGGEDTAPGGTRAFTILVVEDDDDVRAYSVEVLRDLGYRVLEAHDGPIGLAAS